MAPTTAFNGRNISEDSLAISTAILAAAYAVRQPKSPPRLVAPSLGTSQVSPKAEVMERTMVDDVAASALVSRWDVSVRTSSAGDAGAEVEVSVGGFDLRWTITMVDVQSNSIIGLM